MSFTKFIETIGTGIKKNRIDKDMSYDWGEGGPCLSNFWDLQEQQILPGSLFVFITKKSNNIGISVFRIVIQEGCFRK